MERPLRAEPLAVLVGLEQVVGPEQRDARVAHPELGVEVDEVAQLAAVFRAVVPPRRDQDHGVIALQLR
jgi:hypothetical protein